MKKEIIYGVQMTSLENMMFSKWISNNGIAMNTKTEDERKQFTINWLNDYEKNKLGQNVR